MKRDPDAPKAADILSAMLDPENMPERVNGPLTTPDEQLAEKAAVVNALREAKVMVGCVGCGANVQLNDDVAMCTCGGFVCASCQRVETEGECEHELSDFVKRMREQDGDDDPS